MNHSHSGPRRANDFIIGFRAVMEALHAGLDLDKVLMQKGLQGDLARESRKALHDAGIPYQLVPAEKLNGITRANHQGIIAFRSEVTFGSLDEIIQRAFEAGEDPCLVILDQVTDVRNFGAVCRSAECFGAHAVVIPEKGSARVNEEAMKTSAGALLNLPVCRERSLSEVITRLQQSGIRVVAFTEKTSQSIRDTNLSGPICVVLGAEDTGISVEVLKKADELLKIPMTGKTSSLNVSVAAGIALYEVHSQRALAAGSR